MATIPLGLRIRRQSHRELAKAQDIMVQALYDIFPKGAVFAQPVTIIMTYDDSQIIGNENNVDIGLWKKNKWIKQGGTLDTALNTITFNVTEFRASAP